MKTIQSRFLSFVLLMIFWFSLVIAQDNPMAPNIVEIDVHRVLPFTSISSEELTVADSISQLNKRFKPEWVEKYKSVEVTTLHDGKKKTTKSKTDILSADQKKCLLSADTGADIDVKIKYWPDNSLSKNDLKEIEFDFTIDPDRDAEFPGGREKMMAYLKENILDQVEEGVISGYQLAALYFTIDEIGQITNVNIFESSKDEKTDKIMYDAICAMPVWTPASYTDGLIVKQEFAFTLGNPQSCVVNLLSIGKPDQ